MTNIENYISIAKRQGYEKMPVHFSLCPSLKRKFDDYVRETGFQVDRTIVNIPDLRPVVAPTNVFMEYHGKTFKEGTRIDSYGVAHEPGSAAAFHMTKMYFPMEKLDSVEQIMEYPLPDYSNADPEEQIKAVKRAHENDIVALGNMQCTVWEQSWYMRGMENLMADMMMEDPIAEAILDRVTDISVTRAASFAKSGVDALFLGDDIGMQHTIMM
ncbi:MAG: hypothetical protein IKB34_04740, partial [Clostridia bacterium]|nr:hypothetical protein [Clostridia bacterium]